MYKVIKRKVGIMMTIGSTIGFIYGILMVYSIVRIIFLKEKMVLSDWPIILGPIFLVVFPYFLFLKVSINKEKITTKSIFGHRNIFWKNVKEIRLQGNFYGGYLLSLTLNNRRAAQAVPISTFRNSRELAKAAIEATLHCNPQVRLNSLAQNLIHQPPYNVLNVETR